MCPSTMIALLLMYAPVLVGGRYVCRLSGMTPIFGMIIDYFIYNNV